MGGGLRRSVIAWMVRCPTAIEQAYCQPDFVGGDAVVTEDQLLRSGMEHLHGPENVVYKPDVLSSSASSETAGHM
jgi:hypothetical protein